MEKKCRREKSRRLGKEKRQTLMERENPITGHRIGRVFNQDMENRKANLTTFAKREVSLVTKALCKMGRRNFEARTPLGTKRKVSTEPTNCHP